MTAGIGRVRHVAAATALVTASVGIGLVLGGLRDTALETAIGYVFYLSAAWAVTREAARAGSPLPPVHDLSLSPRRLGELVTIVVATFTISLAGLYLSLILLSWPLETWVTNTFLRPDPEVTGGLLHRALIAVETVALGPIVEELVFRGVLLHWWSRIWGLRRAVIVSALAFGAMHFDPLGTTVFAFVATALYMSFGTMLAPIVFHAAWNCAVTILAAMPRGNDTPAETIQSFRAEWPWALGMLAVAVLVVAGMLRVLRPAAGWALPPLGLEGASVGDARAARPGGDG